jgi:hypothetical protein
MTLTAAVPAVSAPVADNASALSFRLLMLLIVAGALAVGWGLCATRPPTATIEVPAFLPPAGFDDMDLETIRHRQEDIPSEHVEAEELEPPPEFDVAVHVDSKGLKNRLFLEITETHGYYVEALTVEVWYKPGPGPVPEGWSPLVMHPVNKYIKVGETLRDCLELVKFEVDLIGGTLGTEENWYAEVSRYGRALETNPDPLPALPQGFDRCAPDP